MDGEFVRWLFSGKRVLAELRARDCNCMWLDMKGSEMGLGDCLLWMFDFYRS